MKLDINNTNIILLLYVIFMTILLCSSVEKDLIVHVLLIVVLSIFAIYLYKKNSLDNFIANNNTLDRELSRFDDLLTEDIVNRKTADTETESKSLVQPYNSNPKMGSQLDSTMGDYDQIRIDAGKHQKKRILIPAFTQEMVLADTDCGYLSAPCNVALHDNPIHVNPDGIEVPYDTDTTNMPLNDVIGHEKPDQNMFIFSHNKCSPSCCPSNYSCDNGCVCTTKEQRAFLASGGRSPV